MLSVMVSNRFQLEEARAGTRAGTLRRTANILDRIARNFGFLEQVEFQIKALLAASTEALLRDFRDGWLMELKGYSAEYDYDISPVLDVWNSDLSKNLAESERQRSVMLKKAGKATSEYAFASLVAGIMRVVENGDLPRLGKLIDAMEQASEHRPASATRRRRSSSGGLVQGPLSGGNQGLVFRSALG